MHSHNRQLLGLPQLDCAAVESSSQSLIHSVKPSASGDFRKCSDCNSPARGKTEKDTAAEAVLPASLKQQKLCHFLGLLAFSKTGPLFTLHMVGAAAGNKGRGSAIVQYRRQGEWSIRNAILQRWAFYPLSLRCKCWGMVSTDPGKREQKDFIYISTSQK